jgi:hypothetical protein
MYLHNCVQLRTHKITVAAALWGGTPAHTRHSRSAVGIAVCVGVIPHDVLLIRLPAHPQRVVEHGPCYESASCVTTKEQT